MRLNANTALVGSKVVLVPYRASHVPLYHEWMSSPEIREATASEELSVEEEYAMQKSWAVDEDKLTFIVLKRLPDVFPSDPTFLAQHSPSQMIGDVNVFLQQSYPSDDESDADPSAPSSPQPRCEVELMIAIPSTRRQGLGLAALQMFLSYASTELRLPPIAFFARIGVRNDASLRLFDKVGFRRGKESVFKEVEMLWDGGGEWGWDKGYEVLSIPDEV